MTVPCRLTLLLTLTPFLWLTGCDQNPTPDAGVTDAGVVSDAGVGDAGADLCGSGVLVTGEACDDGNTTEGDGCSATCAVETGFACTGTPSLCSALCGDGLQVGDEQCDDDSVVAGDGCSATCTLEPGFTCAGTPSVCATRCDDGVTAGLEQCDDGDLGAGDGCSATCTLEAGFTCTGTPSVCATRCDDGVTAGLEQCDDGNLTPGDGCSGTCGLEAGFSCAGEPSVCATTCADGVPAGLEECDDGASAPGDGCSATCTRESGYTCTGSPSVCATTCADGVTAGFEECDDGASAPGDGCSANCTLEAGYTCAGAPSVCATTCGDGVTAGLEECDDGASAPGDGCSGTCTRESGFTCTGTPSVCANICGDGMVVGTEQCDDANSSSLDGCLSTCRWSTGDSCAEPLATASPTSTDGGAYTWLLDAGLVSGVDGVFACDPNGGGPDAVLVYDKLSGTLDAGGKLLHVRAAINSGTTSSYLNVEVRAGACGDDAGISQKCLWYKRDWDVYLDVPAGPYQVWVGKNSPATASVPFPETTVLIEELAPKLAEGEGCFEPYTSASAIYAPPLASGLPHTWTLPASINSFDMGPTWGAPGSISCDDTTPYGDIHGVDAVIRFDKTSPTSVLQVQVTNLDPTLSQSDLNIEVMNVCDPLSSSRQTLQCRANTDSVQLSAPSPAGPVWLWVSTEATGEEFNGARVEVTELFPGPGESWLTAQPLLSSGPVTATSTMRLDAPSCFPATGNVHWFSYTLTNDALSLSAAESGYLGISDASGQELGCLANTTVSYGLVASPGTTVYFAVTSPTPITAFTIADVVYTGVKGRVTDLNVTFPSSALAEYGMATSGSSLYMGDTTSIFAMPLLGNSLATEHGSADGLTATHLGYDLVAVNGSLFSVDSTTSTTASRVYRVFDALAWGPAPWDTAPSYPASSPTYALATDGNTLFQATRRTSVSANFYSLPLAGAAAPTLLGTNSSVWYVTGLAADAAYLYVASNGLQGEGVYRLSRSDVTAAPVKLATLDVDTLCTNLELDSYATPQHLYVRDGLGDVHVVVSPAAVAPRHLGVISTLGTTSDFAMTLHQPTGALYLFESETAAGGRIVRLD